jgi:CRISPR/Cas system-associated exonuclease Cas4 (RecB family)
LSGIEISVSDLAFDVCQTNRNLYLEKVIGVQTQADSNRAEGKAIEYVLFEAQRRVKEHVQEVASTSKLEGLDVARYLRERSDEVVRSAIGFARDHSRQLDFNQLDMGRLDARLRHLLLREGIYAGALLTQRVSKLREPKLFEYFQTAMDCAVEPTFAAPELGLRSPVKPDFAFMSSIPGDIKTGTWHEYLKLAVVAYVMAWEADRKVQVHGGYIHHIDFDAHSPIPLHFHTSYVPASPELRTLFVQKRDRKLEVLRDGKDPGRPPKQTCVDNGCPFIFHCW